MGIIYATRPLLSPIFAGYYLKDKNFLTQQGAVISMIAGFAGCATAQIVNTEIPYVAYGLTASFIGLILGSYLTRAKASTQLEISSNAN